MKIRIISSKDEIGTLKTGDKIVHLAFRPSNKDIMTLVSLCPSVKAIHIPSSYKKTLSESIQMFLTMHNVVLLEGDVWGHRKDINEYFEIPAETVNMIHELKGTGASTDDIISRLRETKLSADLVRFVLTS
ncbi:DUF1699 family protein [Methanimicrococcus blatticola]|uniref:Uncharacterized protein DUF1699 n=1 Tax=Methanimicrococcus blatticola TaxID=91560 RepID=A0A484F3T9_9EURY|nr:DUF1699 family protein [Methanimicrococcus blatticola]MBZ3935278.1 DUF1699 family protein [Methanimicrococcus blatticola]MCC2508624.1 DUF1699 family protein [Methanimicrococcus blatticola]TDQ67929.1 uncharacterized protein DUF1699 [Methanimicrococcus blatticola]